MLTHHIFKDVRGTKRLTLRYRFLKEACWQIPWNPGKPSWLVEVEALSVLLSAAVIVQLHVKFIFLFSWHFHKIVIFDHCFIIFVIVLLLFLTKWWGTLVFLQEVQCEAHLTGLIRLLGLSPDLSRSGWMQICFVGHWCRRGGLQPVSRRVNVQLEEKLLEGTQSHRLQSSLRPARCWTNRTKTWLCVSSRGKTMPQRTWITGWLPLN